MKASNTEIYNAIDGSVWFEESDIEQLALAVESNDLTEIGRLYVAMLEKSIQAERGRKLERAKEYGNFFRDIFCPAPSFPGHPKSDTQYELTIKGSDEVDALRAGGAI